MKLAYIRWKDAVAEEAADGLSHPSHAQLVELQEVGFLLDENDEAVEIGMEVTDASDVHPGRWRLHIPRVSIEEMHVIDLDKLISRKRRRPPSSRT